MNKTTQELMKAVNILMEFYDNLPDINNKYSETTEDIDLLKSYMDYEIKKALKDIIHIERL